MPGFASTHARSLDLLQKALDLLLLVLTWSLTGPHHLGPDSQLLVILICGVTYITAANLLKLYASHRAERIMQQLWSILLVTLITFSTLLLIKQALPRLNQKLQLDELLLWAGSSLLTLSLWRLSYRSLLHRLRALGVNTRAACLIGDPALSQQLRLRFERNPWMGIHVDSECNSHDAASIEAHLTRARRGEFELIYLALPLSEHDLLKRLMIELSDTAASVYLLPDVFSFDLMHSRSERIDDLPVISLYDTPFSPVSEFLKRMLDIVVSLSALILLSPLMISLAIAIRVSSPGPALFQQTRYGLNGRPITVLKFRTMTTQDNGEVVQQARRHDPRVTPLGAMLRRSSLDELPQFLNVLAGSMSVVGPRPHAVAHNEEYRQQIPGYMLRHKVKPGITGWAQIHGWRGETDTLEKMEMRIQYDLEYIRRWSLWLDLRIIMQTAFKGFISPNAY